jgi:hypothetical protein
MSVSGGVTTALHTFLTDKDDGDDDFGSGDGGVGGGDRIGGDDATAMSLSPSLPDTVTCLPLLAPRVCDLQERMRSRLTMASRCLEENQVGVLISSFHSLLSIITCLALVLLPINHSFLLCVLTLFHLTLSGGRGDEPPSKLAPPRSHLSIVTCLCNQSLILKSRIVRFLSHESRKSLLSLH